MTKTLYIDMDGVLVDFKSAYSKLTAEERAKFNPGNLPDSKAAYDEVPEQAHDLVIILSMILYLL